MIVIGVCAGPGNRFETIAGPALARDASQAEVIVLRNQPSIAIAYNRILDAACKKEGLEAVVLLHDDVELVDPGWEHKLLAALVPEGTAVVGVVGGSGPGGMAWFSRSHKHGGIPGLEFGDRWARVGVVDGLFIALSPEAARTLRFDEISYPPFHGYDADICSRALAAGQSVVLAPIDVVHHTAGLFGTTSSYSDWIKAGLAWRIAWEPAKGPKRSFWRLRHALVPLEVRIRPSTRAKRRQLMARRTPTP